MTAPFAIDAGDARLSVNPGPWGVAIGVQAMEFWAARTPGQATVTLASEQATKVAAALILAAATATSYREVTETVSEPR